jgi:hypothetical protein
MLSGSVMGCCWQLQERRRGCRGTSEQGGGVCVGGGGVSGCRVVRAASTHLPKVVLVVSGVGWGGGVSGSVRGTDQGFLLQQVQQ